MIYTVSANPALDLILTVPAIEFETVLRAYEVRREMGGKGFNVSRYLKALGVTNVAVAFAGGFTGQALFSTRFLIQWIMSERAKQSVMPVAFWYFSLAGGVVLLSYAIYRRDPVFMLGQSMGLIVYARNLWLIRAHNRTA